MDPPLFQMPSWENRLLGNVLPMHNADLQSKMFYLQGIHFHITLKKCMSYTSHVFSEDSLDPDIFSDAVRICFLNNMFHFSASLVLGYNLFLFVCFSDRTSEVSFIRLKIFVMIIRNLF